MNIRAMIDKIREKRYKVMITYDISDVHEEFYQKVYDLVSDRKICERISRSHYEFNDVMTEAEIMDLSIEIKNLFLKNAALNEAAAKKTIVKLIRPDGEIFKYYKIIGA